MNCDGGGDNKWEVDSDGPVKGPFPDPRLPGGGKKGGGKKGGKKGGDGKGRGKKGGGAPRG